MSLIIQLETDADVQEACKALGLERKNNWQEYRKGNISYEVARENDERIKIKFRSLQISKSKKKRLANSNNRKIKFIENIRDLSSRIGEFNLLSIDVEASFASHKAYEIGITEVYEGYISVRNLCIESDNRPKRNFLYGDTEYYPNFRSICDVVQPLVNRADYLIGHTLENDKRMMGNFVNTSGKSVLDTFYIANYILPEGPFNLKALCNRFGYPLAGHHCGGNDAYATYLLLMKLLSVVPK